MKEPERPVDLKKLHKFVARINCEARKLFPDGNGDSSVSIEVVDRSRNERPTTQLPIAYEHLIETDEEWRDAIRRLSCNAQSASHRLDTCIQSYDYRKRREEGRKKFERELKILAFKLNSSISLDAGGKASTGMRWVYLSQKGTEGVAALKDSSVIQIRNLFDYRDNERAQLLAWVKDQIEQWNAANLPPGIKTYRPPFMLSINGEMAHLYVEVPKKSAGR